MSASLQASIAEVLVLFHNAVGLTIERATRCMVTPMTRISHEGFGRTEPIAFP